jgi:outer membrane protein OmpA-like peptidoglycan-associated protein
LDTFYFSSDRNSECCLELFAANKARTKKRVKGQFINCLTAAPLPGVKVTITQDDFNNVTLSRDVTDEQGKYEVLLDEYQPFKIRAERDGFLPKEIEVTRISLRDTMIVSTRSCLEPPEKPFEKVDKPIVIDNIYFDYDSATLRPESYPVLDSVVGLMERYPEMSIEVSGHTDNKGGAEYNRKLSEARAKAFVDYVVSKGIEATRMTSKGYGLSKPLAPNTINGKDNPEGRQKNRRTEIKVLHY